ncbi:hypothetical protein [Actinocrinis sp.]|uniref:hypothetical protein n=1 Tax=Actinocrinis sp. TaxID=1920516 RepID=UPI002D525B48|nr:hypothetical protein [Actinocrinis sp.]HZP55016.1 hypothetical protein [Actinocrinis sp.]
MTIGIAREPSRARAVLISAGSLATWPASALLILLHARGAVIASPRAFAVAWTWLVALGCLGCPVYGLRLFGNRLSPSVARHVGILFAGVAVILTGLIATGQLHPRTTIIYASLILPMAIAIQAFNAAEVLCREQRAYEAGRRDALADALRERTAVAEVLRRLDDATLEDLEREHEALGMIVDAARRDARRPGSRPDLRALPRPDDMFGS